MPCQMKSILHIGMPKSMSTTIQTYLRVMKNTHFMGIGPSKFVDRDVLDAVQRQIVRMPSMFYDRAFVAKVFEGNLKKAQDDGATLFALSDETIPFPLGYSRPETSYTERLVRLREVMPENTGVLMIVRRPEDYLRSNYKHRTIRNGMNCSYEDYLKHLILLGDSYFLSTVKFFQYAEEARRIFGTVRVMAMEEIADDTEVLTSFFEELGAGEAERLSWENQGIANEKIEAFRQLLDGFGNTLTDDDFNVISPYERFICDDNVAYFGNIFAKILAKEKTLEYLRELTVQLPSGSPGECFKISNQTRAFLTGYVAESNTELADRYGVDTKGYDYGLFV